MTSSNTDRAKTPARSVFAEPDALLNLRTVVATVGLCRASIYAKIKKGEFCQPVKLSPRCNRWRAGDIQAWLQAHSKGVKHG